jgi:hypothetical protein
MRSEITHFVIGVDRVVGVVVASSHGFFGHLNALPPLVSAGLAVALWPLVLLGVDLHLR